MSSSKPNDEITALAIVAGMAGIVVMAIAAIFFAVLAFLAVVFTVLCLWAWDEPLTLGKFTIQPEEARAFIIRGLIGMVTLPLFAAFCAVLFKFPIHGPVWPYLFFGGYVLGSIGIEILMAQEEQNAPPTITLPAQHIEPPQRAVLPPPSPAPFRYASWGDEEARK